MPNFTCSLLHLIMSDVYGLLKTVSKWLHIYKLSCFTLYLLPLALMIAAGRTHLTIRNFGSDKKIQLRIRSWLLHTNFILGGNFTRTNSLFDARLCLIISTYAVRQALPMMKPVCKFYVAAIIKKIRYFGTLYGAYKHSKHLIANNSRGVRERRNKFLSLPNATACLGTQRKPFAARSDNW